MIQDNTTKWKVRKFTDFASNQAMPVGYVHWSISPIVPAGELPLIGGTYDRSLYADLWSWANENGLVISESEWQASVLESGKCDKFSEGNGSTTFRVPKLPTTIVTDASDGEIPVVGNGRALGLTNGSTDYGLTIKYNSSVGSRLSGYTSSLNVNAGTKLSTTGDFNQDMYAVGVSTNPNNSNLKTQIHSAKITGQWLIVAFGTVSNVGNADVANIMQAVEQVQTGVSTLEQGVGTAVDYIIESYRNGTSWYRKYKSGRIEQGGVVNIPSTGSGQTALITLVTPFPSTNYYAFGVPNDTNLTVGVDSDSLGHAYSKTTLNFTLKIGSLLTKTNVVWYASAY